MYLSRDKYNSIKDIVSGLQTYNDTHQPVFYRLNNPENEAAFTKLLKEHPQIRVSDTIDSQLKELIKTLHPSTFFLTEDSLALAVSDHLQGSDPFAYGVWVYYPWLEKVVHTLDEMEYTQVRTNRNKHKITAAEQAELSKKKIGVMGLSVGQSVSLTLAMERGFGELRIADFDVLDLSNLNRIRSGIQNVGLKKTTIVAREIAEIDPFLKVTCYDNGITAENIDAFLTDGGQLDLLIDECDSFDIKISSRQKAKALGIPVLMEGSDRCTIDIERFDLEPERPVLHGFVDHLDMSVYKDLKTMDERIPYIAPVTGIETLSPRMKASAVEIMNTISTWPQLGSAVIYGGGITADLSRKILLDQLHLSGRFFIDMDELIADPKTEQKKFAATENETSSLDIPAFLHEHPFDKGVTGNATLSRTEIERLINAALQAPSGGNSQPWLWHYTQDTLHLFLNPKVRGAYLDPDFISSYQSLGAAIENLIVQANADGISVNWAFTPEFLTEHIAYFRFSKGLENNEEARRLAKQIGLRHTNRKAGQASEPNPDELELLKTVVENYPEANLHWITAQDKKSAIGHISGEADLLRMFISEAHEDFISREMRWTPDEALQREDGIGIHTLDLSNNDQIGLRLIKDNRTVRFLDQIKGGGIFKRLAGRQFQSSSAIGLITISNPDPVNFLKAGIASEKMWLKATEMGYQVHPVNVPLIFFYKNRFEAEPGLSQLHREHINKLKEEFNTLFDISSDTVEVFMFRLFKAENSEFRTIRKPIIKTLTFGTQ